MELLAVTYFLGKLYWRCLTGSKYVSKRILRLCLYFTYSRHLYSFFWDVFLLAHVITKETFYWTSPFSGKILLHVHFEIGHTLSHHSPGGVWQMTCKLQLVFDKEIYCNIYQCLWFHGLPQQFFSEIWSYENVTSDLIIYQRTYEQKLKRQMIVKKYFSVRIFFYRKQSPELPFSCQKCRWEI